MREFDITSKLKLFCVIGIAISGLWAHGATDSNACERLLASVSTVSMHQRLEAPNASTAMARAQYIFSHRSPDQQVKIDEVLTRNHAQREMSFQTKNKRTGLYDNFTDVPVNGQIVPIAHSDFKTLVKSAGPVLRALRGLLQKIYSTQELTVEALGLQSLPAKEAEIVLRVLRESIYLEPFLRAPQMANYPFLAVSGFDGAIVDPVHPKPLFFELNLGTPSGMSNNVQLLEDLARADHELWQAISPNLPYDDTFELLRRTIKDNARAWTGKDGISVVVSPGVYNGAHPDVAALARFSGMPLVMSSDLYEDQSGDIRLNTGFGNDHPIVTGIYGRMEESFFLQSNEHGIPLIRPEYSDLKDLEKKLGLTLRPGASYLFIRDDQGKIVDIERGPNGEPLLEEIWDSIGYDPSRNDGYRGSFARAILNRKLYYSAIGGRVVDDKRLFRIVSEYLSDQSSEEDIAHPIQGLTPYQLDRFYQEPNKFVVKEPANSGGVGIHFMGSLNEEERAQVIAKVRKSPGDYEIQYVSPLVTVPTADLSSMNSKHSIIDVRMSIMMGPDGHVNAGPNSLLIRTAPEKSLYTNTSQGGGYGIGVVMEETADDWRRRWVSDYPPYTPYVAQSQRQNVAESLEGLYTLFRELEMALMDDPIDVEDMRKPAMELTYKLRWSLSLMMLEDAELISELRGFAQAETSSFPQVQSLNLKIKKFFRDIYEARSHTLRALPEVNQVFSRHQQFESLFKQFNGYVEPDPLTELRGRIEMQMLDSPEITFSEPRPYSRFEKVELAVYTHCDNPEVQEILDFVHANGGQVRLMKSRVIDLSSGHFQMWHFESPYFWARINPGNPAHLMPVIAIDMNQDRALAALQHELQHFKIWIEFLHQFQAEGWNYENAALKANAAVLTDENIVRGERQAVDMEMKIEREMPNHPFNLPRLRDRPAHFYQPQYVNRVTYPEFSAIREVLRRTKLGQAPLDEAALGKYMHALIAEAEVTKAKAKQYWAEVLKPEDGLMSVNRKDAEYWEHSSLYRIITRPFGLERLHSDGTLDLFRRAFNQACAELGYSVEECGGDPEGAPHH